MGKILEAIMNVEKLLIEATKTLKEGNTPSPRLDAEVLLANRLNVERTYLIMSWSEEVSENIKELFVKDIARRLKGEPVAYIINKKEFMGLEFALDSKVLIPRPDTEILVELIVEYLNKKNGEKEVLDIGTGSGAIAISIAYYAKDSKVLAVDIDKDALETARKNAKTILKNQTSIEFILSDCYENLPDEKKFDVIVSNPPYISEKDMKDLGKDVKDFEPEIALCGGADGLDFYKKISKQAPYRLVKGGLLAFEVGYDQGAAVKEILIENGFGEIIITKDLAGMDRVVTGVLP